MAIPTQFSVTSTRTAPIANPSAPKDAPQALGAESVSLVDGASIIPSLAVGNIDSPDTLTAESVVVIDAPVEKTALNKAAIDAPVEKTALNKAAIDAPVEKTALNKALIDVPVEKTALNKALIDVPTAASSESKASISTPNTLTTSAGTPTTPPFPLNHARILYENELIAYQSVSQSEGTGINALKPNTFEAWNFDSTASNSALLITLSSAAPIDTICIGAHNLGDIGATVSLTYSVDGVAFLDWEPDFAVTSNAAIMRHRASPLTVKAIQISITSGTSSAGRIGYVSAGVSLQMQRPFFNGHTPITDADVTSYYHNKTESGNIIGQAIRSQGYKTTYSWNNIDDTWYRTYFAPFKQAIKAQPFFIAWNLLEYPLDVGFGRVAQDISVAMQNGTVTKRNGLSFEFLGF